MKILITIIASLVFSMSSAAVDPTGPLVIFTSSDIEVRMLDDSQTRFFEISEFNFQEQNLEFETEKEISFIQIFKADGQLTFQLPVMSNKLKIGRSVFGEGDFRIGFMIKGQSEIQFAEVNFKS